MLTAINCSDCASTSFNGVGSQPGKVENFVNRKVILHGSQNSSKTIKYESPKSNKLIYDYND